MWRARTPPPTKLINDATSVDGPAGCAGVGVPQRLVGGVVKLASKCRRAGKSSNRQIKMRPHFSLSHERISGSRGAETPPCLSWHCSRRALGPLKGLQMRRGGPGWRRSRWSHRPSSRALVETMSCWLRSMMTPGVRRSRWMRRWSSWLGMLGEAAGSQVDTGSEAEVGAVYVVVGTVVEEYASGSRDRRPGEARCWRCVLVEPDHAEHDVGAVAGQVELVAQPGGFDPAVGVCAGQP